MDDKSYQQLIRSYDLDTLQNVKKRIDQSSYPERLDWIESEITRRKEGIPTLAGPEQVLFDFSRTEEYAGIYYRLPSLIIDLLTIFIPVSILFDALLDSPAWVAIVLLPLCYPAYQIVCTLLWGQSLGKFMTGIVVIPVEPAKSLTFFVVLRRYWFDLILAGLMIGSFLWQVYSGFNPVGQPTLEAKYSSFHFANHYWDRIDDLWDIWIWSEILLICLDERRRSLQEFFSATLVVHKVHRFHLNKERTFEPSYYEWLSTRLHLS